MDIDLLELLYFTEIMKETKYCHFEDFIDKYNCLDYVKCEECPYYYADNI